MAEDQQFNHFHQQLTLIQEKQIENNTSLAKQDQREELLHEIDQQGKKVFNHLASTWVKDPEMTQTLRIAQEEYDDHMRKYRQRLDLEKQALLEEKRSLMDKEDGLHYVKRSVEQEEST